MRLVVDTSVLIGDLLRVAGRKRVADDRLELFLPEEMWAELQVELPRRVAAFARRRGLPSDVADELVSAVFAAVERNVLVVDEAVYAAYEDEARSRSMRDSDDWPLVACALTVDAGIWTNDNDLLGVGVATWTTETLTAWLERNRVWTAVRHCNTRRRGTVENR